MTLGSPLMSLFQSARLVAAGQENARVNSPASATAFGRPDCQPAIFSLIRRRQLLLAVFLHVGLGRFVGVMHGA